MNRSPAAVPPCSRAAIQPYSHAAMQPSPQTAGAARQEPPTLQASGNPHAKEHAPAGRGTRHTAQNTKHEARNTRRACAAGIVTASIRMIFPYGTRRKDSIKAVIFPFKAVTAQAEHKELKEHNDLRAAQKLSASGTGPRIRKPAEPQVGKPSPAGTNSSAQGPKKPPQETKPSLEGGCAEAMQSIGAALRTQGFP